uniref:Cell cycle control protein n=1 Tax=Panagrolaimus superbus TaxID=310955 RepID=A0A914Z2H7_9BILA
MNRKASYINPAYAHDEGVTPEFRRPSNCIRTKSKHLTFKEKIMQQKMDAWKPVYEPISMIGFLFVISVIFVVLGILMQREINRILDIEKRYTCEITENPNDDPNSDIITMKPCIFNITSYITGDVVIMYRITNFFQNYRTYEATTFHGALLNSKNCEHADYVTGDPDPLVKFIEDKIDDLPRVNKRCGAGSDFMYQDSFTITMEDGTENGTIVPLTQEGILQDEDRKYYKNPEILQKVRDSNLWQEVFRNCNIVFSECWKTPIYELDMANFSNNGLQNADYLVWRRKAAFSTFIKPYRKLNKTKIFNHGLPPGIYTITGEIKTHFCAESKIKKQVMITVTSWLGIRNLWFAKLYLVVGGIGLCLTAWLIFSHYKYGKTLDEKCNDSLPPLYFFKETNK